MARKEKQKGKKSKDRICTTMDKRRVMEIG